MINYLSDTITLPTDAMMQSIQEAKLGDDVYGQDETVNHLEEFAAKLTGKEAACFMPSGTMANLASIMAYCPRGTKALVGDESDIYIFEAGGASVCGGIMYEPIRTQSDGSLSIEDLANAIPIDKNDPQFALPALICLENTHNRCGGKALSLDYLSKIKRFGDENHIPIYMDGARVFNAALSLGVDIKEITQHVDSLQFCLSKGLSAPVGSIVSGTKQHINEVRRIRKMLGGGMRQAGILAAPALVALQTMIDRLTEDHQKAKRLAKELEAIDGIEVETKDVHSNIIMFKINNENFTWKSFLEAAEKNNVIFSEMGYGRIRAVIHRHITDDDITSTIKIIKEILHSTIIKSY
ncbi:aminotransferase class I/II-fold pyridoxal phosphate-dependent enzyme [Cytobacillus kochii]|uniref:GntG family PLP-dependent aldolase n=1 Tax=Cytobacillus TaxID=2675230 RepID=UPI0030F8F0B3